MRPKKCKHISCHLLLNILSRLPVKSLKRFECVCKSWYNLIIKDPEFAIQHRLQSERVNQNRLLVQAGNRHLSMLCFDDITEDVSLQWLTLPNIFDMGLKILGPCNGIYCFSNTASIPNFIAVLANIALREFKDVPHLSITRPSGFPYLKIKVCGFGFDPKTNDYKLVMIERYSGQLRPYYVYRVQVYSLRSNSWRKLGSTLFNNSMWRDSHISSFTVYINGYCHWFVRHGFNDDPYVILSFNMADEVFRLIRVPQLLDFLPYCDSNIQIALYNNSLSMIVLQKPGKKYDVWIMQDYGNESWTKLVSIGPIAGVTYPLGFWRNGKLLFKNFEGIQDFLSSYDPSTKKIKNLHACGSWGAYSESLVSIRGDRRDDQNIVKEDGSTHQKMRRRRRTR